MAYNLGSAVVHAIQYATVDAGSAAEAKVVENLKEDAVALVVDTICVAVPGTHRRRNDGAGW